MKVTLSLRVNGEDRDVVVPVHKTLLEVLREDVGLTGTKHGCELGECGTCTVLVDGTPVLSCLTLPVELQGREVTTVEGLARGGRLHPRRPLPGAGRSGGNACGAIPGPSAADSARAADRSGPARRRRTPADVRVLTATMDSAPTKSACRSSMPRRTGAEMAQTPGRYSPSSRAMPARSAFSSSCRYFSGSVTDLEVKAGNRRGKASSDLLEARKTFATEPANAGRRWPGGAVTLSW